MNARKIVRLGRKKKETVEWLVAVFSRPNARGVINGRERERDNKAKTALACCLLANRARELYTPVAAVVTLLYAPRIVSLSPSVGCASRQ